MLFDIAMNFMPQEEPSRIQVLISILNLGIRREEGLMAVDNAVKALRKRTGTTYDYEVFGSREKKKAALARWKSSGTKIRISCSGIRTGSVSSWRNHETYRLRCHLCYDSNDTLGRVSG